MATQASTLAKIDEFRAETAGISVPPLPPAFIPSINLQSLQGTADNLPVLAFWRWCTFMRYDREQVLTTLPTTGGQLRMIAVRHFNGAAMQVGAVTVQVTLTPLNDDGTLGVPINAAPYNPTPTASSFNVPMPALPGGKWYRLTATAGAWQVPAWYAYVGEVGVPLPKAMPVVRASWERMHPPGGVPASPAVATYTAADAIVPAVFDPVTVPYQQPVFQNTSAIPTRATCVETHIVLSRPIDVYRPGIASTGYRDPEDGAAVPTKPRLPGVVGVMTSFNNEPYSYWELIGTPTRRFPLLDGPRGRGTLFAAQHIQPARNGKWLATDNWRCVRIEADGYVRTLLGPYVPPTATPTLWSDTPRQNELMAGDWSAVSGPWGFNECWGIAIDLRTVAVDLTAPIIPPNTEPPHVGIGPVMYFPDRFSSGGRIIKAQFNGGGDAALAVFGNRDREAPAKVTVWKLLPEPWDCVIDGVRLIVSEHASNRIAVYDLDTGAEVDSWPMPVAYPSPEGLAIVNGVLYYACVAIAPATPTSAGGNLTGGQIRKRVLATGVDTLHIQLTLPWVIDGNSRFAKIAVESTGTFGPLGMLALASWSGNNLGYPTLFDPSGTKINSFPVQSTPGPGLPWKIGGQYPTAPGFGPGCLACTSIQEGVRIISKAQPADANTTTATYLAGRDEWINRGFNLTNGDDGFGFNKAIPQRWDVSLQINEYLTKHGHVRP